MTVCCPGCGRADMAGITHICPPVGTRQGNAVGYQTCPKCGGQGFVAKPPRVPGDIDEWQATSTGSFSCPVCLGAKVLARA